MGAVADGARRLEAIHAGHVDVEEEKLRLVLVQDLVDVPAVFHLVDDLELRPHAGKPRAKLRAKQRFVVSDDGSDRAHAPLPTGTSIDATTPWGGRSSITSLADTP